MEQKPTKGLLVAALATLSTAGALTIMQHEGFTTEAVIPVANDRPTIGYGATYHADGSPVKLGDRLTAQEAQTLFAHHARWNERCVQRALGDALITQTFFDLAADHVHQFGCRAFETSSMARLAKRGELLAACDAFTRWRFYQGADCADPANWYGRGKDCRGVYLRALKKQEKCLESLYE